MNKSPLFTNLISFLWGLLEATVFFLVPDIWLSREAIFSLRRALFSICFAVLGALIGGAIIYYFANLNAEQIGSLLDNIPGISPDLMAKPEAQISDIGFFSSLLNGMLTGIPYKIYAYQAALQNIPFYLFIVFSTVARSARFMTVTFFVWTINAALKNRCSLRIRLWLHAICWGVFYILYFYIFGI